MKFPLHFVPIVLALATAQAWGETIPIYEAKSHIGETATVCGKVAGEITAPSANGTRTFISLDSPYPHQAFTVVIWEEDQKEVGPPPPQGHRLCATGKLGIWRGVPQIVARFGWQLSR